MENDVSRYMTHRQQHQQAKHLHNDPIGSTITASSSLSSPQHRKEFSTTMMSTMNTTTVGMSSSSSLLKTNARSSKGIVFASQQHQQQQDEAISAPNHEGQQTNETPKNPTFSRNYVAEQRDIQKEPNVEDQEVLNGSATTPTSPSSTTVQKDAAQAKTTTTANTKNSTTMPPPVPAFYQPYWNLTCPLELSMFSGAHMGQDDYIRRAWAAREESEKAVVYFAATDFSALKGRRIVFVGDSMMRQVFISMACLAWDRVIDYSIPWFHRRMVRIRQPNTIGSGPHSKFEEGRVLLKGGIELIYHHGIGGLLELGEEYQSHETETWIKACYLKQPLTALVPKYVDWSTVSSTSSVSTVRDSITSTNVKRERLTFHSKDIVLINASVHGARSFNMKNIVDLLKCQKRNTLVNSNGETAEFNPKPNKNSNNRGSPRHVGGGERWPQMLYVVTGPRHFPTKTGAFEKRLLTMTEDYDCIDESTDREFQEEESSVLGGHLPFIGTDILPLQYKSGRMHVGGRDCLHWMQPGIPDLLAVDVLRYIAARLVYQ